MPKQKLISIYKQAENGLLAHIYEHAFVTQLEHYLIAREAYVVIDYSIRAKTYGRICIIEIQTYSKSGYLLVKKALTAANRSSLKEAPIMKAVLECGIEYQRNIDFVDKSLFAKINTLHTQTWSDIATLPAQKADATTSVDALFATPTVSYKAVRYTQFKIYNLQHRINNDQLNNDPANTALAILLMQIIALNTLASLRSKGLFYDAGDSWESVSYTNWIATSKQSPLDWGQIEKTAKNELEQWQHKNRIKKIIELLDKSYKQEENQYFSLETMHEITGGIFLGYEGWRDAAKPEIIEGILKSIKIHLDE